VKLDFFRRGVRYVPNAIGSVDPTSKSATAKLIRRKEVLLRPLLFFQKTNMVKMLASMTIMDSIMADIKRAIIVVLYMIDALSCTSKVFSLFT